MENYRATGNSSESNSIVNCENQTAGPEGSQHKKAKEWNKLIVKLEVDTNGLNGIIIEDLSEKSQNESAKYDLGDTEFQVDYTPLTHKAGPSEGSRNLTQNANERIKRPTLNEPEPKRSKTMTLDRYSVITIYKEVPPPKVAFSQVDDAEGLTRKVISLGGTVYDGHELLNATHLVMTRVGRSSKFLRALCVVNYVLRSDWLIDSARAGRFLPPNNYRIKDTEIEADFNFSIERVLQSTNRRSLFAGKTFYLTKGILPNIFELYYMITMCGGDIDTSARELIKIMRSTHDSLDSNNYFIITCAEDLPIFGNEKRQAKLADFIHSEEFVFQSILQQSIQYHIE